MSRIYLDHAATTPLRPEAADAMRAGFETWANPSSPHAEGRASRRLLEDSRERCKKALGWEGELIFTSGASEALAIGLGAAKADRKIVSAVEHDSVFRAAGDAEIVGVGVGHEIDRRQLADLLDNPGRAVVAIQHVNSETGTIQPVSEYMAMVREVGGLLISDCSQSAGKFALPDADMIVVSAHKLGGPIGIGALLIRDFSMLEPSGGQERGYRAGTENMPLAVAFAAALENANFDTWSTDIDERARFRGRFVALRCLIGSATSAPHIMALTHPKMSAQALLIRLDSAGFAVSAGSACSSGTLKRSRTLEALGVDEDRAGRTVRVSLGWNTAPDDLADFSKTWERLV